MPHIGVDEAGKGDYFGYLVVAAVLVNEETEHALREMNVRDSKAISDRVIHVLAQKIKKICRYDIVKVSPETYNELYKKFKSLNKLLAWGHARAIENLLQKNEVDYVLTDKFADERFLNKALMERGKKMEIRQEIRAEVDMAVAAASILARDEFVRTLRALGRDIGHVLPKGAAHVEEAARELVKKYGEEILSKVAKVHFKTTKSVLKK